MPATSSPVFLPLTGLARAASVHRTTAWRLMAQGELSPDGFVLIGEVSNPIFLQTRAAELVRKSLQPAAAEQRPPEAA